MMPDHHSFAAQHTRDAARIARGGPIRRLERRLSAPDMMALLCLFWALIIGVAIVLWRVW